MFYHLLCLVCTNRILTEAIQLKKNQCIADRIEKMAQKIILFIEGREKKTSSLRVGFEPTSEDHIRFQV